MRKGAYTLQQTNMNDVNESVHDATKCIACFGEGNPSCSNCLPTAPRSDSGLRMWSRIDLQATDHGPSLRTVVLEGFQEATSMSTITNRNSSDCNLAFNTLSCQTKILRFFFNKRQAFSIAVAQMNLFLCSRLFGETRFDQTFSVWTYPIRSHAMVVITKTSSDRK